MRIKRVMLLGVAAALAVSMAGCASLDVIGKDAVRAFGDILEAYPAEKISDGNWRLAAPDNSAWFEISNDVIMMTVEAQPFVDAGLDLTKLNNTSENSIVFLSPGFDMLNQNIKDTPLEQFEYDIGCLRNDLSYHSGMDHYGISFEDGNMFEWAKDMSKNDKDIVFVLNPEPLISAGVDPNAVEGWVFAKVTVDVDGKMTEVDKLLKPFDLK